jgi:dienelactone hydrolase
LDPWLRSPSRQQSTIHVLACRPYEPINVAKALKDEASRRETFGRLMATTDPERSTRDTGAFLAFLAAQPQVKGEAVGMTGYCMGGGHAGTNTMTLTAILLDPLRVQPV